MSTIDKILVYDTETSGLRPPPDDGVVEHAWIEIDEHYNEIEQVHSLINPGVKISPSAAGVHGITDDMVADAPSMDQFMIGIRGDELRTKSVLIVAHNAPFDLKFIAPYCGEVDTCCTLKLARKAFPESPDHKLPTLMHYLGITKKGTHNALDDVLTCLAVLKKCGEALGLDLQGLYDLASYKEPVTPETPIPFGKHKGTPLGKLNRGYVRWLLKNATELDPDIRRILVSI